MLGVADACNLLFGYKAILFYILPLNLTFFRVASQFFGSWAVARPYWILSKVYISWALGGMQIQFSTKGLFTSAIDLLLSPKSYLGFNLDFLKCEDGKSSL